MLQWEVRDEVSDGVGHLVGHHRPYQTTPPRHRPRQTDSQASRKREFENGFPVFPRFRL